MKVLVADRGDQVGDFAWTVPGEVVYLTEVCDRDRAGAGDCGCARSFVGLVSRRATTVARVRDLAGLNPAALVELVRTSLADTGWANVDELARDAAEEIAEVADMFGEDTLVRRSFDDVALA